MLARRQAEIDSTRAVASPGGKGVEAGNGPCFGYAVDFNPMGVPFGEINQPWV